MIVTALHPGFGRMVTGIGDLSALSPVQTGELKRLFRESNGLLLVRTGRTDHDPSAVKAFVRYFTIRRSTSIAHSHAISSVEPDPLGHISPARPFSIGMSPHAAMAVVLYWAPALFRSRAGQAFRRARRQREVKYPSSNIVSPALSL